MLLITYNNPAVDVCQAFDTGMAEEDMRERFTTPFPA
jgi:hypothetical protein